MMATALMCPTCRRGTLRRHCSRTVEGSKVLGSSTCDLVRCDLCTGFGLPPDADGTSRRWWTPKADAA